MNKETRKMVQSHLGYSDEEMAIFMHNPRNEVYFDRTRLLAALARKQ